MVKAKNPTAPVTSDEGTTTTKTPPVTKSRVGKLPKKGVSTRPVIYPDVEVRLCKGEDAITAEQAKALMGWVTETDDVKFGSDYFIVDEDGKKVRCTNNGHNRPLSETWARTIAQDILQRNWKLNGETVIIGKTGEVLSAQHRLTGLILAEQMRTGKNAAKWEDKWKGPVTMETVLVLGIDETDDVTRTLDNVKPRTLSDVLYCNPEFMSKLKPNERVECAKMLDKAIKLLWERTGRTKNAFVRYKTHSEALNWIDAHPKLLKCVQHIMEENTDTTVTTADGEKKVKAIGRFLTPGFAAAAMYLMATASSDSDKYRLAMLTGEESEKKLKFDLYDKASDFWALVGSGGEDFQELRYAMAGLVDPESGEGGGSLSEKLALIATAWDLYRQGKKFTSKNLKLNYHTDEDGFRTLISPMPFGGIDAGDPAYRDEEDEAPEPTDDDTEDNDEGEGDSAGMTIPISDLVGSGPDSSDPTPDEIEARKAEVREQHKAALLARRNKPSKGSSLSDDEG